MMKVTDEIICIIASLIMMTFSNQTIEIKETPVVNKEQEIMTIIIDKIALNNKIYDHNSKENDIDKNVLLIPESDYPDKENGTVLIGGHSGTGKKAFFAKLNEIEINDKITLVYNNKEYVYIVDNISKDSKDGILRIDYPVRYNRLVIYTCHPNDKKSYLVINSHLDFTA